MKYLIFYRFYQTMREKVVTKLRDSTGRRPHCRYTSTTPTHTNTPLMYNHPHTIINSI